MVTELESILYSDTFTWEEMVPYYLPIVNYVYIFDSGGAAEDRLANAAREKLSQASKEKQVQAERKRKAAMFINLLKNKPTSTDESSRDAPPESRTFCVQSGR